MIREDFIIEAYEILELFCELLLARLGVINISKYANILCEELHQLETLNIDRSPFRECPADIKEAVCTIIYAAPRTDIKELSVVSGDPRTFYDILEVREQLYFKFGKDLAHEAVHNCDNCVNARVSTWCQEMWLTRYR